MFKDNRRDNKNREEGTDGLLPSGEETVRKMGGEQISELQQRLENAFDRGSLRRFVRTRLNVRLDLIAGGTNLKETIFNLIEWAEREGRLEELIQKTSRYNPRMSKLYLLCQRFFLFAVFIFALFAATRYFSHKRIVLLDTYARIYNQKDKFGWRPNGAAIFDILHDLDVKIDPQSTYPNWVAKHEEQIRRENPDLIIMHQSCFCKEEAANADCHVSEDELYAFLRYMQDTKTKFLIYTRYLYGESIIKHAEEIIPKMKGRLYPFPMTREHKPHEFKTYTFDDPEIQWDLKQRVKVLLNL